VRAQPALECGSASYRLPLSPIFTFRTITESGAWFVGCSHVSVAELIDRKGGSWRYRTPRRAAPAPCPLNMVVKNVSSFLVARTCSQGPRFVRSTRKCRRRTKQVRDTSFRTCGKTLECCHPEPVRCHPERSEGSRTASKILIARSFAALRMTALQRFSAAVRSW
jgi:hypothetical protein